MTVQEIGEILSGVLTAVSLVAIVGLVAWWGMCVQYTLQQIETAIRELTEAVRGKD